MTGPVHFMYECTSPSCRLRFPAADNPWPRGCPLCDEPVGAGTEFLIESSDRTPAGNPSRRVCAVLDNVRSVLNVGAMFRTADAVGISHVHLLGITAPGDHPQIEKTALGAQSTIAWTSHRHGPTAIEALKGAGTEVWAVESGPAARSIFAVEPGDIGPSVAIVVGNENSGIDPEILALADRQVAIPMFGHKQSLNVGTAFGIAAYILTGASD